MLVFSVFQPLLNINLAFITSIISISQKVEVGLFISFFNPEKLSCIKTEQGVET